MGTFSNQLLNKREALLRTVPKPCKSPDYTTEPSKRLAGAKEGESARGNITAAVHRSVRNLLKLGFSYSQIIEGSGVSDAFLRQTFKELSLDLQAQELPQQSTNGFSPTAGFRGDIEVPEERSDVDSSGESSSGSTEKRTTRKIEAELRLFMLKTRLEVNRLRSVTKQYHFTKELQQKDTQLTIKALKAKIFANLEEFFNELESGTAVTYPKQEDVTTKRVRSGSEFTQEESRKKLKSPDQGNLTATADPVTEPPEASAKMKEVTVCVPNKREPFSSLLTLSFPTQKRLLSAANYSFTESRSQGTVQPSVSPFVPYQPVVASHVPRPR